MVHDAFLPISRMVSIPVEVAGGACSPWILRRIDGPSPWLQDQIVSLGPDNSTGGSIWGVTCRWTRVLWGVLVQAFQLDIAAVVVMSSLTVVGITLGTTCENIDGGDRAHSIFNIGSSTSNRICKLERLSRQMPSCLLCWQV